MTVGELEQWRAKAGADWVDAGLGRLLLVRAAAAATATLCVAASVRKDEYVRRVCLGGCDAGRYSACECE